MGCSNIPKRIVLAIMIFIMTLMSYMTRVNLSISIVAMAEGTENSTQVLPDYGPRLDWSQHAQGQILAAYFVGYFITSVPSGTIAEIFGGKGVSSFSMLLTALLTALTPICAHWHKWAICANRFILGVLGGTIYPCMHYLISKWVPPHEKGKFMAVLFGGSFGIMLTWAASGVAIEHLGWEWSFYTVAIFAFLFSVLWMYSTADSPAQHKSISVEEREYIEQSLIGFSGGKKTFPPYLALLASLPFWASLILHFGNLWSIFFLITAIPKYLSEALNFNLHDTGLISSLPFLVTIATSVVFGLWADHIRTKNYISVTLIRKSFCIFSHILPGCLLIVLGFFGKNPYICVPIITLLTASTGAACTTNLQLPQDMAPKFAASVFGMINFVGTSSGFISPMVVAAFTKEESTVETWCYVFVIAGVICILAALFFWVFGSAKVQKWNYIEGEEIKRP